MTAGKVSKKESVKQTFRLQEKYLTRNTSASWQSLKQTFRLARKSFKKGICKTNFPAGEEKFQKRNL